MKHYCVPIVNQLGGDGLGDGRYPAHLSQPKDQKVGHMFRWLYLLLLDHVTLICRCSLCTVLQSVNDSVVYLHLILADGCLVCLFHPEDKQRYGNNSNK